MDNYAGKRLDGRYEIQEVIGVGGMAVVYKAYDNIDDRTVAVKILKEEYLANEEFRRRFKNESKAIAVLSHPNIVKVFNVNYGDRLQYIVMEYVEGITLKEYIEQQGKLGIKETVYFTMQILRAIQHAHDKGIVHRDIKPQNIMLLSNGNIKVTDFGIARFSYSDTKTMTDSAIGSVHYISPEQARGGSTDERADIYSVGVVMYEMLTGQLPFQSDNSVSVALMQLQNEPKRPRELNSNIPIGLEQIIMHAMRKNVNDRYQSAAEMLLDIEEFKRNPTIRFQRDYFVDNEPTKYLSSKSDSIRQERNSVQTRVKNSTRTRPENEYEEEEEGHRNKVAPVLIGLFIGLLVLSIAVFGVLYFATDFFQKDGKYVPNFVGKNYETEIKDNVDYKDIYRFDVKEISNSAYTDGLVFDQEPKSGQKMDSSNNVIVLYVAKNAQKVVVTDVAGMQYSVAAETLEKKGFIVNSLPIMNTYLAFGEVIRTEPEANTEAESGSIVTIYYASDEDLIEVPNVTDIGFTEEVAKAIIESASLIFDTNVKTENSSKEAGIVIGQSPEAGEKVIAGSKVSIIVSSGIPEISKANIKIKLPSGNSSGSFEVFVDNESVVNKTLLLDGSDYSFTIEGSGSETPIKVFINGTEYYSCNVDFSKSPGEVSEGVYANASNSAKRKSIPNVVGLTAAQAESTLKAEGFTNIKIKEEYTANSSENNIVLSQSPEASQTGLLSIPTQYPLDYEITLYVGKGMF